MKSIFVLLMMFTGALLNVSTTVAAPVIASPTPTSKLPFVQVENVKDPRFGATGDGVTDDGPSIAAAFAAGSTEGLQVYFPAGIYLVNGPVDITIAKDLTIYADAGAVIRGAGTNNSEVIGIQGSSARPRVMMTGHGTIDNSLRTFTDNISSGTALTLNGLSQFSCEGWTFSSAADLNHGDSGISAVRVEDFTVRRCTFVNQPDCGIYLSGNTDEVPTLDRSAVIEGNFFKNCGIGVSSKRRYRQTIINANHFIDDYFGVTLWEVGDLPAGREAIVTNNFFDKTHNTPIEFRESIFGGVISGNHITDWGYTNYSTRTLSNYNSAILLTGSRNVAVTGNVIAMKDWQPSPQHFGLIIRDWNLTGAGGTVNFASQKNLISGNVFRNHPEGIVEQPISDLASDYGPNTFDSVGTPYVVGNAVNIITSRPVEATVSNAPISVAHNTDIALPCSFVNSDSDGLHPPNSARLVAPLPGRYRIEANVAFANNPTGLREVSFKLSTGPTYIESKNAVNGDATYFSFVATTPRLAKGDYVELRCIQNSGGALNVTPGLFTMVRIQ